ncbi:DUF58 domain-containing protein [Puniceibacterium sp. IMCC21224]|uniref:DUF58 domain-containing protein n=1 Tax=Puniceibacterium sp. IMCC21224 TaxID=1618204 RepID=UPI00064DA391|nr:DUF58 domain-containing protein [Puniceibacterium sp. IMCC21224]KMK65189.1 Protein of unknown function DUF58 [Puniceibacterium sp. IMCC21224]
MTAALDAPGIALRAEALIGLRGLSGQGAETVPLSTLPGGFVTKRRGHGQEVADVREYVDGDDIRHLDRGSTARTGTLHVRRFQEERDRVTLLVADFRPSMLWGTRRAFRSVAAAEALAMIGWRVVEDGGRVGLLALGAGDPVAVPVRGRARGMLAVIGGMVRAHDAALQLTLAGVTEDPPLDAALERLARVAPQGAELVIASGFDAPGAGLADRLSALAQRRVPRLLLVQDAVAAGLPPGNYPIRLPDGGRARARIGAQVAAPVLERHIAGHPALALDAGAEPQMTARLLNAAFPPDREP